MQESIACAEVPQPHISIPIPTCVPLIWIPCFSCGKGTLPFSQFCSSNDQLVFQIKHMSNSLFSERKVKTNEHDI